MGSTIVLVSIGMTSEGETYIVMFLYSSCVETGVAYMMGENRLLDE